MIAWEKRASSLLGALITLPLIVAARIGDRLAGPGLFQFAGRLLSLVPGRIGQYLRSGFYVRTLMACPSDICVGFMSCFTVPWAMVGERVFIGSFSTIGNALIGNGVLIGSRVTVGREDGEGPPVVIEDNSWVGEGALVLANVGPSTTVGAGCVVTDGVPGAAIAVGNPLRLL
ncbi:MAG: acyltransferase [Acidiferrobacteraceae bacterium]